MAECGGLPASCGTEVSWCFFRELVRGKSDNAAIPGAVVGGHCTHAHRHRQRRGPGRAAADMRVQGYSSISRACMCCRWCWVWNSSKCLFLIIISRHIATPEYTISDKDNYSHVQFIFSFIFPINQIYPPLPGKQKHKRIWKRAGCTSGLRLTT